MASLLEPGVALRPDPMVPRLVTLERTRAETADTFTMELVAPDGVTEFPFLPGQFNMVGALGVGEVPISVSGDPQTPRTIVHTTREVGAVTNALKQLRPGAALTLRGPYGTAWPVEACSGHDVVLIAGGIGLAPLRPVIYEVMRQRARFGRFLVLYGTRSPEDILFAKELSRWRSQFDMELLVTVDRGTEHWRGNVGVVTKLVARAPFEPRETVAMVCGPEVMMRFAVAELRARGVAEPNIHVSLERNMKCGVGLCGHCQLRGEFICRSGPVYSYDRVAPLFEVREL
ncbi:MAG: FAD/NAD(P)-binding protein [Fimbriimonadaceae bacterium]|nr:FAD/NAD(P)-binding protein [Fimbriimonadaceae bacterium]